MTKPHQYGQLTYEDTEKISTYMILTYSMQQSPSWEANWFSVSQEILHILWNPRVHYCIYKCPPPVPILAQIDLVHAPPSHLLKMHLNIYPPIYIWVFQDMILMYDIIKKFVINCPYLALSCAGTHINMTVQQNIQILLQISLIV